LGIKDIEKRNLCLLCKWWRKLDTRKSLWQDIIKAKYMRKDAVVIVKHKLGDSLVWADLLKVKSLYLSKRVVQIRNGVVAMLWTHPMGGGLLCVANAPLLFELCTEKDITLKEFIAKKWLNWVQTMAAWNYKSAVGGA
jgi:hypothetical protein